MSVNLAELEHVLARLNGVMERLDRELARARARRNHEVVRVLTIVREGSLYGHKDNTNAYSRKNYLGEEGKNDS